MYFGKSSVEYLGHAIDKKMLHPFKENVRAIQQAPPPEIWPN